MEIDEVGIDKGGIDKVGIDKVGITQHMHLLTMVYIYNIICSRVLEL